SHKEHPELRQGNLRVFEGCAGSIYHECNRPMNSAFLYVRSSGIRLNRLEVCIQLGYNSIIICTPSERTQFENCTHANLPSLCNRFYQTLRSIPLGSVNCFRPNFLSAPFLGEQETFEILELVHTKWSRRKATILAHSRLSKDN